MAKKKRLNKKVIIILASLTALLMVGVVGVLIWRQPEAPHVCASRAAKFLEKGKYALAVRNYAIAAHNAKKDDPKKPEYYLSLANALLEWIQKDKSLADGTRSRYYGEARSSLRKAMIFDPNFVDAQRRLTNLEYRILSHPHRPDYKGCIVTVNKLLALAPDDHEALYKRAVAYAQLAENDAAHIESAMEDFRTLVKLAPCQERYWIGLVRIHLISQDADHFEQVDKTYKEALSANKDSVGLRINYAQFLLHRDRKDEALKLFQEAAEVRPDKAAGYLALASYYRQERDLDRTVENLEKAAKVEPANYRSYEGLARIYTSRKASAEAEAILKKGLDAVRKSKKPEPKSAELLNYHVGIVELNHQLCDILFDRAATSAESEKVLQAVRDALKEMQEQLQAVGQGSRLFAHIDPYIAKIEGRLVLVDGNLVEAEKLLRRAYDSFRTTDGRHYLEPKTAQLLINLYRRLGLPGESRKILARFASAKGSSQSARMGMLRLYVESRQYAQAQRLVRLMLEKERSESLLSIQAGLDAVMERSSRIPVGLKELDSLAVYMFQHRAQQLWLEGKAESAIQLLSDILARQPKHLATMMKLIQWHRLRKESVQADEMLALARKAYEDDPQVLDQLMLMVSDRKKLLEHLLAQASAETDPVRKSLRLAGIYRTFRREKEFLEHLSAAEAKAPKNPSVIRQRFEYVLGKSDWKSAERYAAAAAENNIDTVDGKMFAARLAVARGKIDEAIGLVTEAVRIRPRFSQARCFLGDCYLAKGQTDQAKQQYESAYSQNPTSVSALVGMIRVSAIATNADEYARWVKLAYKFAPQNQQIKEAYLRLLIRDPEKVIEHREHTYRKQPGNLTNLSHLAMLYERTGRLAQAEQAFRAMVRVSGGNPAMVRAMAHFLRRRNRGVEARGMLADYAAKATDKITAYLVWADYLNVAGEADQAEAIYKKAIAVDPKDVRGYIGAARSAARHGRWEQAVDNQQKYIDIAGEKTPPLAEKNLVAYLINAEKLDDAERKIDRRLKKDQADVEMLTLKALIYIKREDYTKAREILDNALKIRSDYVPALVRRADVHLVRGDKARAVADLESAMRAGAIPAVGVRLANLYESISDVDNALVVLQGLLAEHPKDPNVLKALAGLYGRHKQWPALEKILADGKKAYPKDTFYLRKEAEMWLIRKVPSRAVAALDEAAKLAPDNVGVAFFRMQALVQAERYDEALSVGKGLLDHKDITPSVTAVMALAHAKAGSLPAAETEFAAAIKAAKSGKQLWFVLRQVRSAYRPPHAVEKLKLLAKGRPNDAQIYQMLGEILMGQKDPKGAVEYFKKALAHAKVDQHKVLLMGRLGLVYFELGQHAASLRMYQDTLEITPKDPEVLNNLAWLLAHDMKKPDQALPYARKASELVPDSAEVLDTYGYVLMLKGEYNEALNVLSRSVDKRAIPANRLHLGEVHEKMKHLDDAYRQYQLGWELIKDKPDSKYYREFNEAIKRLGGKPGGSTGQ